MEKLQIINKKYIFVFFILITVFIIFFCLLFFLDNNDKKVKNLNTNLFLKDKISQKSDDTITIISTGDIGLVRDINYRIKQKNNPNYPFLNIASYLRDADLTIINLEGPLIKDCPIVLEGFTFCGESENVKGLTYAGIDAASLANNHTTNYGLNGLRQTENVLESNNIAAFGLENKIRYIQLKDKKIALVGFVELGNNWGGLNNATVENVKNLNNTARNNADIVINAFHWGVEYTYNPSENQKYLARTAIDTGADIVLGNHPHWIQPIEVYKDKYIIYAQGNTIFDQDWSQETKEGVLYKFAYKNGLFKIIDEKYTIVEDNSQPRLATKIESEIIKNKVLKGDN